MEYMIYGLVDGKDRVLCTKLGDSFASFVAACWAADVERSVLVIEVNSLMAVRCGRS
jgi:hypothetical protein